MVIVTLERLAMRIYVDVLTADNVLYQGQLGSYILNEEGELSGLILRAAAHFNRDEYLAHQNADSVSP
jgi:hypothetical protein